jgi:hypothetical protein
MCQAHKNACVMSKERSCYFLLELMVQYLLGTWTKCFQMILLRVRLKERKINVSLITLTTLNILLKKLLGLLAASFNA